MVFDKLSNFYIKNPDATYLNKDSFRLSGVKYTVSTLMSDFTDSFLMSKLSDAEFVKVRKKCLEDKTFMKKMASKVMAQITSTLESGIKDKFKTTDLLSADLKNTGLFIDIVQGKKNSGWVIIDNSTKECMDFDPDEVLNCLTPKEREAVLETAVKGVIEYNPRTTSNTRETFVSGRKVTAINSYIKPDWIRLEGIESKIPVEIEKLLRHLFPRDKDYEYVLDWLANSLTNRNQTYLLLNSSTGTGKGVFCNLFSQLMGKTNFTMVSENFFKSRFNNEIKDKTGIVLDEVPITRENKNELKYMINDHITIESKGCDPLVNYPNFASFIISNNYNHNCFLVANDRRFSVPHVTNKKLTEVFKESEISSLIHTKFRDIHYLASFGQYLLERAENKTIDSHRAIMDEKFRELCLASLAEWESFIVSKVVSKELPSYPKRELQLEFAEINPSSKIGGYSKLQRLFAEYTDPEGEIFATVKRTSQDIYLIPTDKYMPPEGSEFKETEDDDLDLSELGL